jgi:hypothetical protein
MKGAVLVIIGLIVGGISMCGCVKEKKEQEELKEAPFPGAGSPTLGLPDRIVIKQGEKKVVDMKVYNHLFEGQLYFKVKTRPEVSLPEGVKIDFEPRPLQVTYHTNYTVKIKIEIPQNAKPGDYPLQITCDKPPFGGKNIILSIVERQP